MAQSGGVNKYHICPGWRRLCLSVLFVFDFEIRLLFVKDSYFGKHLSPLSVLVIFKAWVVSIQSTSIMEYSLQNRRMVFQKLNGLLTNRSHT